MIKILMVEDDLELAEILTEFLEQYDMQVITLDDPFMALTRVKIEKFDLVILDLTLPGMDGLEVAEEMLNKQKIPIIISSARSDIQDKVKALELGADDYLPKPYDPRELEVRIKTVLRRWSSSSKNSNPQEENSDFVVDNDAMELYFKNEKLNLTNAEFGLLAYLIKKKGTVVSREELIQNVNAINESSSNKSIDVIIGRIRQKIGDNPKDPTYIISVRGFGYKLTK